MRKKVKMVRGSGFGTSDSRKLRRATLLSARNS